VCDHALLLLLLLCYRFYKGIYNYIPEASHVCRVYNVPVLTVYGTRNVIFCNKHFVLSHQYSLKYARSAQYGCFL